jgi:hypothetical protein
VQVRDLIRYGQRGTTVSDEKELLNSTTRKHSKLLKVNPALDRRNFRN